MELSIDNPGTKELRKFGLIFGAIFSLLFGLFFPWVFSNEWPMWPWIVAGVFWLWAIALPGSLFPVYKIWLQFGHIAGWINTRLILGIVFYLVFLPTGLIMRLLGKDPMKRKLDSNVVSYRVVSESAPKDHVEGPY